MFDDVGTWIDDEPEDDGYDDARCPYCGAGADEQCSFDCAGGDEDEDDEFL
jgi:hypothetical protein